MSDMQKIYFLITGITLISNSLFASQAAAGSKTATAAQVTSAPKTLVNAQQSTAGASAAFNKQEKEYDVKVTTEDTVSTITKKTVLTHNPTGQILEEIIVFSKKDNENDPFKQILSSKIVGSRALYT
jgi:hypothetical protein